MVCIKSPPPPQCHGKQAISDLYAASSPYDIAAFSYRHRHRPLPFPTSRSRSRSISYRLLKKKAILSRRYLSNHRIPRQNLPLLT